MDKMIVSQLRLAIQLLQNALLHMEAQAPANAQTPEPAFDLRAGLAQLTLPQMELPAPPGIGDRKKKIRSPWTKEDDAILMDNYTSGAALAQGLSVSRAHTSIWQRIRHLKQTGVMAPDVRRTPSKDWYWHPQEDATLKYNYENGLPLNTNLPDRSLGAAKGRRVNLRKSAIPSVKEQQRWSREDNLKLFENWRKDIPLTTGLSVKRTLPAVNLQFKRLEETYPDGKIP